MSTYRAFEATGSHEFALVHRELHEPAPGQVRLQVLTCGVCHSDSLGAEGFRADPSQPIVPGHEIVGVIDAVGDGVSAWRVGERVGVSFLGGQCNECDHCRRGDFIHCTDQPQTGTSVDGGYAEVVYARTSGLVRIPEGISAVDAAPLLCAGMTTYKALVGLDLRPGALVAIQGIGGLGHLGLQYARKLGYRVVAIARGPEKAPLAEQLGADHYIDSAAEDPGAALQRLGGADAIIATAANGASMSPLLGGLAPKGELVVVGAAFDPIAVSIPDLLGGARRISSFLGGTAGETEETVAFSTRNGVRAMTETMPWTEAPKAYGRMMAGDARFRIVLEVAA